MTKEDKVFFPQVGGRITGADEKTSLIEIHSVTDWI